VLLFDAIYVSMDARLWFPDLIWTFLFFMLSLLRKNVGRRGNSMWTK